MAVKRDSSGVSIDSTTPLTYYEAAISVFDRPISHKTRKPKTPKPHKAKVSEYIIEKPTAPSNGTPWNPGVLRQIPYMGVLALLMVLLCAGADAIILYQSDGAEVDSWTISPSVLLAILSAVANTCLQFARSEGVIIAWWRKALHGGTLYDLNRYWESGDSVLAAATPGRGFNLVALATIAVQLVIIDGPLLQRASSVVSVSRTVMVNVTAPIAQELPYGYTGVTTENNTVMNSTFAKIVDEYVKREKITPSFAGCSGNCSGIVKAAGLAVNCSEDSRPWSNAAGSNATGSAGSTVFSSKFSWIAQNSHYVKGRFPSYENGTNPWPTYPFIDFNLAYAIGRTPAIKHAYNGGGRVSVPNDCNGTMMAKRCSLRSATLHYPFSLENNTLSIASNSSSFLVDHIQPVGSMDKWFRGDKDRMTFNTLGGVAVAAQNMFSSLALHTFSLELSGSVASQYLDYGIAPLDFISNQNPCSANWKDPTEDILDALNEIVFRTALRASKYPRYALLNATGDPWWTTFYESAHPEIPDGDDGVPVDQLLLVQQTSKVTVFRSHYLYLAAALAIMVLGVAVVIPTLHGYWELGRETSLNPLEIAKAFNADLMIGEGSNSSVRQMAKGCRKAEVRYGEIIERGSSSSGHSWREATRLEMPRLGMAGPDDVRRPRFRTSYL